MYGEIINKAVCDTMGEFSTAIAAISIRHTYRYFCLHNIKGTELSLVKMASAFLEPFTVGVKGRHKFPTGGK